MGKHARIGVLLAASACLLAVMVDWVVGELHEHEETRPGSRPAHAPDSEGDRLEDPGSAPQDAVSLLPGTMLGARIRAELVFDLGGKAGVERLLPRDEAALGPRELIEVLGNVVSHGVEYRAGDRQIGRAP
jgi:hypothetical protein